jgi:hypothetical protein
MRSGIRTRSGRCFAAGIVFRGIGGRMRRGELMRGERINLLKNHVISKDSQKERNMDKLEPCPFVAVKH